MKKANIACVMLVGMGAVCLFSAEARMMRNLIHSVTDSPGLWRGWIGSFLGWVLIIVPGTFLVASRLSASPRVGVRQTGSVLKWAVASLAFIACVVFAWYNISWGIDTDWTFIK